MTTSAGGNNIVSQMENIYHLRCCTQVDPDPVHGGGLGLGRHLRQEEDQGRAEHHPRGH